MRLRIVVREVRAAIFQNAQILAPSTQRGQRLGHRNTRNAHALGARCLAGFEQHPRLRHAETFGEEGDQAIVGLAVHRRCAKPDFQRVAMLAVDFGLPCAVLNL